MRLSIRMKLNCTFVIILVVMMVMGWRGIVGMNDINKTLNAIKNEDFTPSRMIANAHIALIAWNRATLNHLLSERMQNMDGYERIMLQQNAIVLERIQTLSEMQYLSERGKELILDLSNHYQRAQPIRDRVVELSRAGKQLEARRLASRELRPIIDELDTSMTEFMQLQERQVDEAMMATDERFKQGLIRISLVLVTGLAITLLSILMLSKVVLKGVNEMVRGARLAAVQDFTNAKITITSEDEFGYLGTIFNQMLDSINSSFTKLERAEGELKKYSQRLEEKVEQRTKELRDAQEELIRKEKLAILGQLAGGVGHDLRNPLGTIKNAAYFLNMAVENPEPDVKETLEILGKEVDTSERIISSLLGFARPKPPTLRKVDINETVQVALSRSAVPENVEVVNQLGEALPVVLADPDQLGPVFDNLILNAIQAMPKGGKLTITSDTPDPEWVTISVSDTGAGIPSENLENLFEPLFTTKAKGIGLGLPVARTLIEGHRGTIEVESKAGKGSTFTVRLPVGGGEER